MRSSLSSLRRFELSKVGVKGIVYFFVGCQTDAPLGVLGALKKRLFMRLLVLKTARKSTGGLAHFARLLRHLLRPHFLHASTGLVAGHFLYLGDRDVVEVLHDLQMALLDNGLSWLLRTQLGLVLGCCLGLGPWLSWL